MGIFTLCQALGCANWISVVCFCSLFCCLPVLQTLLSGMGELHLEIIRDRLLKEFKVEIMLGALQVAYRESIAERVSHHYVDELVLHQKAYGVELALEIEAVDDEELKDKDAVADDGSGIVSFTALRSREVAPLFSGEAGARRMAALRAGVVSAAGRGPLLSFPLCGLKVVVKHLKALSFMPEALLTTAASVCFRRVSLVGLFCILSLWCVSACALQVN